MQLVNTYNFFVFLKKTTETYAILKGKNDTHNLGVIDT